MTELETRIIEVATWILKVNPRFEHNYFRSEEIRSIGKIRIERQWSHPSLEAITQTAVNRRIILKKPALALLALEDAMALGRLIYTCPADSTLDGGAEFYSQGLVDIWEVPAWDTWVTVGNEEFKEFGAYENCLISWIPESVYNLFYSGKEVGLEDNMGWVTHLFNNSVLANMVIAPNRLEFIEITDREAIENRLKQINQQLAVETGVAKTSSVTSQASVNSTLLNKIKQWFS